MIVRDELVWSTTAGTDIIDLTAAVESVVKKSAVHEGQVLVFVPGSTAGVTTIEFESGVIEDLRQAIDRLVPQNISYRHDARWGDGNGYAHVRAALLGPSLTLPVMQGKLLRGTWQQVVLIDVDNEPRQRRVIVQVSGEGKSARGR